MTSEQVYDAFSFLAVGIALFGSMATLWVWKLYLSNEDNPPPKSRLLLVIAFKDTLVTVADWVIAGLAVFRLSGNSLGNAGGIVLVVVLTFLMSAHTITVGYLFMLRRRRGAGGTLGKRRPPPFGPDD